MHARLLSHEGPRDKAISVHGSFTHLRRWSRLSHAPRATWPRCSRCIVDRGGSVTRHAGGCSPPLLAPRQPSPRHPGLARNLDRPHYVILPPHETQTTPAYMVLSPMKPRPPPLHHKRPFQPIYPRQGWSRFHQATHSPWQGWSRFHINRFNHHPRSPGCANPCAQPTSVHMATEHANTHNNRVQHAAQSRRLTIMWTRRIAASYAKSPSAPRPGREASFLTKRDTTFPSRRSKQQKTGISFARQCGQNRGTRANGAPANAHAHHAENRSHDPQTHTRAPAGARPPMQAIRAVSLAAK